MPAEYEAKVLDIDPAATADLSHDGIDGTYEVEVTVDSLDATNELLNMLGFHPKSYQENRRTSFALEGARWRSTSGR